MNQDLSSRSVSHASENTLKEFLLAQHYVAIPLEQYPTGHLYTQVVLNNQVGIFLLDTGSGYTLLEEKHKHRYNIKATPSKDIGTGAGGTGLVIELSEPNQLRIGLFRTDACILRVLRLESINARLREFGFQEIDGAIGADLLKEGNAIIDYVQMTLYLKNERLSL